MDNVHMKQVDTKFLKVPEYKRTTQPNVVEHASDHPVFDFVTPKEDDTGSEKVRKDDVNF